MAAIRTTYEGVDVDVILVGAMDGVKNNFADTDEVVINGVTMKKAELIAAIAAKQQPAADVEVARNQLAAKVKARDAAAPSLIGFLTAFEAAITVKVGIDPSEKAKFGLPKPKVKRQLTATETVAKVARMLATRAKRGTLGTRQKEKVKATGDFTVSVGPTSSSSVAAPAQQPAATSGGTLPMVSAALPNGSSNGATNGSGH